MKAFQSLEEIRSADVETLSQVPSMNRAAAEKVYEFFHKETKEKGEKDG